MDVWVRFEMPDVEIKLSGGNIFEFNCFRFMHFILIARVRNNLH